MTLRVGALFAGYGGLERAVEAVFDDVVVQWVSEYEPPTAKVRTPKQGAARILAHNYPDVPNLGDVTAIDWTTVPPVDLLGGGSPCQDVSHAGKRQGMRAGTRSGLWESMREGIAVLRPQFVVWENVRGALSAEADSAVEFCPGCVGGADDGAVLRALGRVLGDLADLGYDTGWCGLRAADVGAPHGRFRVFVLGWRRDGAAVGDVEGDLEMPPLEVPLTVGGPLLPTPVVNDMGTAYTPQTWDEWTARLKASHGNGNGHGDSLAVETLRMLPTPEANIGSNGGSQHPDKRTAGGHSVSLQDVVEHALLPTPVTDPASGNGHARDLGGETAALFPTPTARNASGNGHNNRGEELLPAAVLLPTSTVQHTARNSTAGRRPGAVFALGDTLGDVVYADKFGRYAAAIERWEQVLGRPAPDPTRPDGKGGARRLSPLFVEWMMGLPTGWVTDPDIWRDGFTPSAARNAQLKALGNGIVPQQAAAALRHLLDVRAHALALTTTKGMNP